MDRPPHAPGVMQPVAYVGQRVSREVLSERLLGIALQAEAAGFAETAELLVQAAVTALNEMPHHGSALPKFK